MSKTTVAGDFLDALAAQLSARAGLAKVRVYTAPVAPEDLGEEAIELGEEIPITQEQAAMGKSDMMENVTIHGSILVSKPYPRKTTRVETINAGAKTARDRAVAIFGELASECGDNPTMATGTPPVATVLGVDVTSMTMHQGEAPEAQLGRSCWIEFDLTLQNETPQ